MFFNHEHLDYASDDEEIYDTPSNSVYDGYSSEEESDPDDSSDEHAYRVAERYNDAQENIFERMISAIKCNNREKAYQLMLQLDHDRLIEHQDGIIKAIFSKDASEILEDFQRALKIEGKIRFELLTKALDQQKPKIISVLLKLVYQGFIQPGIIKAFLNTNAYNNFKILAQVEEFYESTNLVSALLTELEKENGYNDIIIMLRQMLWQNYLKEEFAEEERFQAELPKLKKLIDFSNIPLTINRIITSWVYESKRSSVSDFNCRARSKLLKLFDSEGRFANLTKKQLEAYIQNEERNKHTFFGVDPSDDSDSEDEKKLQRNPEKDIVINQAKKIAMKAEIKKIKADLTPNDNTDSSFNENLLSRNKTRYSLAERVQLEPNKDAQIQRDLEKLNNEFAGAVKHGKVPELLNAIPTKFVVMQFRGIAYSTTRFSMAARRAHRQKSEINQPIYSTEVLNRADISKPADLAKTAEILKKQLLSLRETFNVEYQGKKYASAADVIQEKYSTDYDGYHDALRFFGIECRGNPFVSTSDRGDHALRYAYYKEYDKHKGEKLEPRWNRNGVAERNKSGKVYLSIHPLSDYDKDGPLSVTNMVWEGRIFVENAIIAERETSFAAALAGSRVVSEHIAKYPSFKGDYKAIYQIKYGFDKELYTLFKRAIRETPPHSAQHENAKQLLADWLCAYHEVSLIEKAKEYAKKNNLVLIYRQPGERFDFQLFPVTPYSNSKKITAEMKQQVEERKIEIRAEPLTDNLKSIKAAQEFQEGIGIFERWQLDPNEKDAPSQPLTSLRR